MRTILTGLFALVAPVALATPAHAASTESWVMTSRTINGVEQPTRIAAVGPVSGAGFLTQTEEETADGEVVHFTWHLARGTLTGDAVEQYDLSFDPTSCTAKATSSGTWTFTGGTGAYTGASGHGTFTGHATLVGSRGARGECLGPESGAEPKVAVSVLRGISAQDAS